MSFSVCPSMCEYLFFSLLTIYRIKEKGTAFELLSLLSFDRWVLITLSPLPATGRSNWTMHLKVLKMFICFDSTIPLLKGIIRDDHKVTIIHSKMISNAVKLKPASMSNHQGLKTQIWPWSVLVSELSASLQTKGSPVRFPVRVHA